MSHKGDNWSQVYMTGKVKHRKLPFMFNLTVCGLVVNRTPRRYKGKQSYWTVLCERCNG